MVGPFEMAMEDTNNAMLLTFSNATIAIGDNSFRGILDTPLSVKNLDRPAAEIADCNFKLSMLTDEVNAASITKRTKLKITLDSGEVLNLFVLKYPEKDGAGMTEMQLGVSNGASERLDIQY